MAQVKVAQTNWTSGEISPLMLGRFDTTRYQNGADRLLNFIVRQQGGLVRRSGTRYVATVKDSSKRTIIREFKFSDDQAYILEIGEEYIRIYYDGGFVETAPASGVPLEVITPYQEDDLTELQFTQSADIIYIAHPGYQPQQLERLGANSWAIIDFDFQDGPYLSEKQDPILTISGTYRVADATAVGGDVFGSLATKAVTGIVSSTGALGGLVKLTVAGHGYSTGQNILVTGLAFFGLGGNRAVSYPQGNGAYIITVNDANHITLDGSYYAQNGIVTIYVTTGSTTRVNSNIGDFVEFRDNNTWSLAKILSIASTTSAKVSPVGSVKTDVNPAVVLTYKTDNGSYIVADHTGVFTYDDIGKYVKIRSTGSWYRITSFASDAGVFATAVAITAYAYPTIKVNVTPSVTTATITSDTAVFASTDIGRHIRLKFGNKQPWCYITDVISDTKVNVIVTGALPVDPSDVTKFYNGGVADSWKFGAWSDTTGWPSCVCFYEQRMIFANTDTEPQTLWGSATDDYVNFATTEYDSIVIDSNGFSYTIASNEANPIVWLQPGPVLLIGTTGGEWQMKAASSVNQPITPTNVNITPQTSHGSKRNIRPFKVGHSTIFIQKAGRKAIELTYDFQEDSFIGKDLTLISEHILRKGGSAIGTAYQREPNSIVWICLDDGSFCGLTYEREQQVIAWHPHQLGGGGLVESISCIPSAAGTEDLLYLLVKRTVGGVTKRYIEYLTVDFYPTDTTDRTSMQFVDCNLLYDGVSTSVITNLDHLEGMSVTPVVDGFEQLPKVVTGGSITLSSPGSRVYVGFNYRSLLRILPLDGGSRDGGTAQGKTKRTGKTSIRLYNSTGFTYGSDLNRLDTFSPRDAHNVDNAEFISGDRIVNVPGDYGTTGQFYLIQDQAYPLTILSIMPNTEVTQ